ncbi:pirin family protein [Bacteroidota bacterium]
MKVDEFKIIPAKERFYADHNWLKTYWLFSFADYYDPTNIRHGKLRVFNDDIISSHSGFDTHPHREMEIITIVLKGAISHKDSMGNESKIHAGEVQRMSAGTGLTHSEYNNEDEELQLYQIWIFPDKKGLEPSYDQKKFDSSIWKNKIVPIASGQGLKDVVSFHTDASIYRCDLEEGKAVEFDTNIDRNLLLYLSKGKLRINGESLDEKDQLRTRGLTKLNIESIEDAEFILIDVNN